MITYIIEMIVSIIYKVWNMRCSSQEICQWDGYIHTLEVYIPRKSHLTSSRSPLCIVNYWFFSGNPHFPKNGSLVEADISWRYYQYIGSVSCWTCHWKRPMLHQYTCDPNIPNYLFISPVWSIKYAHQAGRANFPFHTITRFIMWPARIRAGIRCQCW
jgi:hypothetical protein